MCRESQSYSNACMEADKSQNKTSSLPRDKNCRANEYWMAELGLYAGEVCRWLMKLKGCRCGGQGLSEYRFVGGKQRQAPAQSWCPGRLQTYLEHN